MNTYKNAIVRTPPRSMKYGISSQQATPDYDLALLQHQNYITQLQQLNIKVHILPPDEDYPDSHFVEDTAILYKNHAITTFPGAASRRGEVKKMQEVLSEIFPVININGDENTLVDGGDIIFIGNQVLIGIYKRTTLKGAQQLKSILLEIDPTLEIHFIYFSGVLHLKTGLTALNTKTLIGNPNINLQTDIPNVEIKWLPPDQGYAANTLTLYNSTLHFSDASEASNVITQIGNKPLPLDISEFKKMDGSFTCLSLLW